jgi:aminopeptidase C
MLYTNTAYEFVNKALDDPKFKKEFFTAMKEKLEREVSISPKNLYEKVIDMNLQGEAAFHNLIKNECL